MKLRAYAMLLVPVIAFVSAETTQLIGSERSYSTTMSQEIVITPNGTQPTTSGSGQYFTGSVRVEPLFDAREPGRTNGASVTFEPGARTAWHTHPLGQTLIVMAGEGRVQRWATPVQVIRAGDVVWIPPGVKHWHGASQTTRMTHTAVQEHVDGKNVEWLEHVTDEQYGQSPAVSSEGEMVTFDDVRKVSPALEMYTKDTLLGGLWKRPGLSPRDRSVVTVAALIARNDTSEMPYHVNLALDNGVKPGELSEMITHLAFYSGWAHATAAVAIARNIFEMRKIGPDQLPPVAGARLPLDEGAEAQRAARVAEDVGPVAPGLEQYTTDVLFRDLWLRPGLAPRDRSLVTVSALIALGHVVQIPYHLNRAMDNGLTRWRRRRCSPIWLSTQAGRTQCPPYPSRRACSRIDRAEALEIGIEVMAMNITFENQVALVTGAASGLGLATAKAFAESGASVALADWNEKAVRAGADDLAAKGHKVLAIRCDVADDTQVEAMVAQTVATFGRLDVAYNNAGVQNVLAETADAPRDDYDRVMSINLGGVWSCMKFELQHMRVQGSGAIVNCSSLGGLIGGARRGSYHGAKHGVLGLTKSAAREYATRGIRVNAVCPGMIQTPMSDDMIAAGQGPELEAMMKTYVPTARLGRPEEIANAVLWLCSSAASYVTGQSISVDGGFVMR